MTTITKEMIQTAFTDLLERIFSLPETAVVRVGRFKIKKEDSLSVQEKKIAKIMERSCPDNSSVLDICVTVNLSPRDRVSGMVYPRLIARYGFTEENCLELKYVPEKAQYHILQKDGIRFDLRFVFERSEFCEYLEISEEELKEAQK